MAIDFKYWKDGQPVIEDGETVTNDFKYWVDGQPMLYVSPASTVIKDIIMAGMIPFPR